VRDTRWKLIEYVVNGRRTTQLFDLLDDPHELRNLAASPAHRSTVLRLRDELCRWPDERGDHQESLGRVFWDGWRNSEQG